MQRPGVQRCAEAGCAEVGHAEAGHAEMCRGQVCRGQVCRGRARTGWVCRERRAWAGAARLLGAPPRRGEKAPTGPAACGPWYSVIWGRGDAWGRPLGWTKEEEGTVGGGNPTTAELWQGAGDGELRPGLCLRVCPRAHSACAHRQRQAHKGPSGAPLPPQPPAAPAPPPRPSWPRPRAGPGPLRWLAAPLGPLAHPAPQCPWYPDPGRPPFCHLEPKRWPRGLSASL